MMAGVRGQARPIVIVVRQPQSGCDYALRLSAGRMPGEVNDSPSDHMAAPSKTTSFSRNCPGIAESAGKPPRLVPIQELKI
jgi:hypothetical protein